MKLIPTTSDPAAERQIIALGLKFTKKIVAYHDIDIEEGLANMARTVGGNGFAINTATVEQYADCMRQGDIFPPPVLLDREGQKYLPIGGNQRFAAWKKSNGGTDFELESYIVKDTDATARQLLPKLLNRTHGLPNSREELLDTALFAKEELGYSVPEAERMCGLAPRALQRHLRFIEAKKRAAKLGLRTDRIAKSVLMATNTLKSDNVFAAAAALLSGKGPSKEEAVELVREINKQRTEDSQLSVIDRREKDTLTKLPSTTAARETQGKRRKFIMAVTALENIIDGKTKLTQFQITDRDEQKTMSERIERLAENLRKISNSKKSTR